MISEVSAAKQEKKPSSTQVHVLSESEIEAQGSSAPGSNASIHNLSISAYNYQVQSVGAQVYTDKWLTGVTRFNVPINNWHILEDYGGTSDQVTISLHTSSGQVASLTITGLQEGGSSPGVNFYNLHASTNYYVKFSVPTNGNRYSFDGSIAKY